MLSVMARFTGFSLSRAHGHEWEAQRRAALSIIADSLPSLVQRLIEIATEGNVPALIYLCDRMLGRPVGQEQLTVQHTVQLTPADYAALAQVAAREARQLAEGKPVHLAVAPPTDSGGATPGAVQSLISGGQQAASLDLGANAGQS